MIRQNMAGLQAEISGLSATRVVGRVISVRGNALRISGLSDLAQIGDRIFIHRRAGDTLAGEVIQLEAAALLVLPDEAPDGVALGDRVVLGEQAVIAPADSWLGRIIDPFGQPLDEKPLLRGAGIRPLRSDPPSAARRRAMGARLESGM